MIRSFLFTIVSGFIALSFAMSATAQRVSIKPKNPENPLPELVSGYYFSNPETRALQDDDFDNPGFLWIELGEQQWSKVEGRAGKSCASCHKNAAKTMSRVGTSYPKINEKTGKLINIEQRINICRRDNLKAKPWKWESNELLAMTAYVRHQSRGKQVRIKLDARTKPLFEKGKKFFYERRGQMNISCAQCHEGHYGNKLRADLLSQGQINGFPTYRLAWQRLGSVHRRFRGCNRLVRAEPFAYGAPEYVNLELYIAWRGNGLPVEAPSVRR